MEPVYDDYGNIIGARDANGQIMPLGGSTGGAVDYNSGTYNPSATPIEDERAAEQEASRRYKVDENQKITDAAQNPPEGIPMSFWQRILNDPQAAKGVAALLDPSKGWDSSSRFPSKQAYLEYLQNTAQSRFAALPAGQKKLFVDADEQGNPFDPLSPEGQNWIKETDERRRLDTTEADFSDWEEGDLAALEAAINDAASGDQAAIAELEKIMSGIKNPELAEYVGDYISQAAQAGPSQEAIAQQQAAYDKNWALTDPTMTAEERLLQEMSRREQEADLRAARGAIANNLQARGVYGSGAELTMGLMAQQEGASRRALDELAARAQASERAMKALEQAGVMSGQIRDAEAQESQFRGTAADRAAEFNKTLKDAYDKWLVDEQRKNNEADIKKAQDIADMKIAANERVVRNRGSKTQIALEGTNAIAAARNHLAVPISNSQGTGVALADRDELEGQLMA